MSYESPIELFQTEPILERIKSETDAYIIQSVWKLGVNVDKDELIKALKYDRDQYNKGYYDGRMYQPPVMTNADKIRAMTDEELANFLMDVASRGGIQTESGIARWTLIDWLKQGVAE